MAMDDTLLEVCGQSSAERQTRSHESRKMGIHSIINKDSLRKSFLRGICTTLVVVVKLASLAPCGG